MTSRSAITRWNSGGLQDTWTPTTLDAIKKSEDFFENVLVESVELLGLETRRSGISGPFQIYTQLSLNRTSSGTIYPDITILAASGHVIVVEVKRHGNSELRDRAVISQIIDYASSFAALDEDQVLDLFRRNHQVDVWGQLIAELFPNQPDTDELAELLLNRIQQGALNLVIACDKVPPGLPDIVKGVASQSTLGFDLDLVEVVPYVRQENESEIVFIPSTKLATEIVARTAVTVTYRHGDDQPSTIVETSSVEDIEETIRGISQNSDKRMWTSQEVVDAFREEGDPTAIELLEFATEHSAGGIFVSPGRKKDATLSFYVEVRQQDGSPRKRCIVGATIGYDCVYIYLTHIREISTPDTHQQFLQRLHQIFGNDVNTQAHTPGISLISLGKHLEEFKELILWFTSKAESDGQLK